MVDGVLTEGYSSALSSSVLALSIAGARRGAPVGREVERALDQFSWPTTEPPRTATKRSGRIVMTTRTSASVTS